MKRRGLSFILAIVFIVSCLTVFVSAAETDQKTQLTLPEKIILSTDSSFKRTIEVQSKNLDGKQISWNIDYEDIVDVNRVGMKQL